MGGCLDIFTLFYLFSSLSPSLLETARYRLKYCLKGPLNPKQPTNQPKADLLNFLSTNRIKNILNVDGSFDKLEDQVLEITIYVNRLMETLKNIQSSKGLVATFTTGSKLSVGLIFSTHFLISE